MAGHVGIIGAGIAGLTAADHLSAADCKVTVFEARPQPGGRILTIHSPFSSQPIELGAEFIHGDRNETWETAKNYPQFNPVQFPDRHWEWKDDRLVENKDFWDDLGEVMEELDGGDHDLSFTTFLRRNRKLPQHARVLAKEYVQGFHAADLESASVVALEDAEESAEETHGQKAFRIPAGSRTLIDCLMTRLNSRGVEFHFDTVVERVQWDKGSAAIFARLNGSKAETFKTERLLVTVPIGVLKAQSGETGAIVFEPDLEEKRGFLDQLEMGCVIKLTLLFSQCLWPQNIFGFIHVHGKSFPVWWTGKNESSIVGWIGGPSANRFSGKPKEELVETALNELSSIFHLSKSQIKNSFLGSFQHDWSHDPFTRGAYTFFPVGTTDVPEKLAQPVEDTLFFAGEAFAPAGESGTVHGAIASGKSAAERILQSL